jgi:hypothetical protein
LLTFADFFTSSRFQRNRGRVSHWPRPVANGRSLRLGSAEWIRDSLYCARGQAENLINLHNAQLASDRMSCHNATANQVRLALHTAA